MNAERRNQRWLPWRNMDVTDDPICPAYGCVEIYGSEFVGTELILLGRSSTAFDREPNTLISETIDGPSVTHTDNDQGAKWYHAFNNECSVNPGDIGYLTFDLPTWAATNHEKNNGAFPGLNTGIMTMGNFAVIGVSRDTNTPRNEYIGTYGAPWRVGGVFRQASPTSAYIWNEACWNVYYFDPQATIVYGNDSVPYGEPVIHAKSKAWIGGARTFLQIFYRNENEPA